MSNDCDGVSDEGAWTTDGPHFAWAEAGPFVLEVAERRDGAGFRWGTFVRMGNVEHGVASGDAATRDDAQRQAQAAAHKWAADAARALPPMATDPVVDLHLRSQAVVDEARVKRHRAVTDGTYVPRLGQSIMDAVHQMHAIAKATGNQVACRFNGINITVRPDRRDNDCDEASERAGHPSGLGETLESWAERRRGVLDGLGGRAGVAALAAREAQVEPSRPEPPPVDRGVPVTPPLVEWLRGRGFEDTARLVEARDAFGREKYGQPLMSEDGRDPIEDARQELGDALQYVQRALMVGADLRPLREPLRALVGLLAKERQAGNVGALAAVLSAPDEGGLT